MKQQVYIGELKTRISINKTVKTQSATGQPIETTQLVKNCWANQIEKNASEDEEGKVRFLYTTEFIVRYDKDLIKGKAADFTIVDEDALEYEVIGVVIKIPKRYLQITTNRRG